MSGDVVDVLHAAGVPGFVYDHAVDPPHATIKGGFSQSMHGKNHWWASCKPCWWWDEDEPGYRTAFDPEVAQARADAHNRIHHPEVTT